MRDKATERLLRKLGSKNEAVVAEAKAAIKQHPDAVALLSEFINRRANRYYRSFRSTFWLCLLYPLIFLLPVLPKEWFIPEKGLYEVTMFFWIVMWSVMIIVYLPYGSTLISLYQSFYTPRAYFRAVELLDELNDVRAIGALLNVTMVQLLKHSRNALTRLLPKLTPEDKAWLTQKERNHLIRLFLNNHKEEFALAALQAFENMREVNAIDAVSSAAEGKKVGKRFASVRLAAQQCLQTLEAEKLKQQQPRYLLRASDPDEEAKELLLRSPSNHDDASAHQLLRSQSEERNEQS